MDKNEKLKAIRHTTEHILTQAVLRFFPKVKMAMGPATDDGFYFDFDPNGEEISEKDFPKIEAEMKKIIKANLPLTREEITIEEGRKIFSDNPFKLEWLDEIEKRGEKPTIYRTGDEFVDLCAGPHVTSTGKVGAFKLLSIAGAYWHGDEKNKMLTRIYGTAFETQEELDIFLKNLEEAKKRDHRKIGKDLDLFLLSEEIGQGLLLLKPKGAIIRREIENFIIKEQTKRGYQHVYTPHIGKKQLWKTSGHWDLYRDKMYSPMKIDKDEYLVKPMNCPFHMMIYKSEKRSYRELPLRIAEIATVYRYEKPGELSGMLRVRHITQDDAHIFCRESQVIDEFIGVFDYMSYLLETFGLKNYYLRLGLRSKKEKYLGNDKIWQKAEEEIVKAVKKKGLEFIKSEGDAAFYGPKLDVVVKDSLGREWQCGTIQVDFMLPERFQLEYVNEEGKIERPVLIHRAPLGSMERFMAILIENYAGNFPLWLTPIQVKVLPITERNLKYAEEITAKLREENIRVELDLRNETLGAKIRDAQIEKVYFMAIVGDREEKEKKISVRGRDGKDYGALTLDSFIKDLQEKISKNL
ncbi:MAG: Threonyl-tRNA synthetase [Candidatus Woesebacteria bacterium]|nr:MAG: Threonyl-tRNA synthetase [Candidatus Woesebacteria bacterium]